MKKMASLVALLVFLFVGISVVVFAALNLDPSYDGSDTDVYELMQDPESYDPSGADGVADIIVGTNLAETEAVNNVAAIVFDYRGYDTLGESFILLTAISGAFVVLHRFKGRKEEDHDET